jgi:hypothetical protein
MLCLVHIANSSNKAQALSGYMQPFHPINFIDNVLCMFIHRV